MNYEQAKAIADVLKAVGNPLRILVLDLLNKREMCVSEICEWLKLEQPTVSRHLAYLKKVGIVREKRVGTKVIYKLALPCILQVFSCTTEVLKGDVEQRQSILNNFLATRRLPKKTQNRQKLKRKR